MSKRDWDDFEDDDYSEDWERRQAEEIDRILAEYDRTESNLKRAIREQINYHELRILDLVDQLISDNGEQAQDAAYAARFFIKRAAGKV